MMLLTTEPETHDPVIAAALHGKLVDLRELRAALLRHHGLSPTFGRISYSGAGWEISLGSLWGADGREITASGGSLAEAVAEIMRPRPPLSSEEAKARLLTELRFNPERLALAKIAFGEPASEKREAAE